MKTKLVFFGVILLVGVFQFSCSSTRGMRIQVQRPARITVDKNIQSLAILNHSMPGKQASIEGTLTLETPKRDKELSEECISGVNNLLITSNRFEVRRCEGNMPASNPTSLDFGATISWEQIDSLCSIYQTDAILALEFFDSDYSIFNPAATAVNAVSDLLNGNGTQVEVTGKATARAGFRMYYPKTQSIVYQDRYSQALTWVQRSANPVEAIAKLIQKNDALFEVSYYTGKMFANDLVPLYYWENRTMYKGKKGLMEIGERQALAQDWEAAIVSWTEVYNTTGKSKNRAKAAFNIAFGQEVLGDLEKERQWIRTSYVEGGKREAYEYSQIIEKRIRQAGILEYQNQ